MEHDLARFLNLSRSILVAILLFDPARIREALLLRKLERAFSLERVDTEQ